MRFSICLQMRITLKNLNSKAQFVPKHEPINKNDIEKLSIFLEDKPNILVLTGAGISTESGIPDYRSEGVGLYARSNHKPVQHMDFVKSKDIRQRYWARNYVGWPKFSAIEPNVTHFTLSKMEKAQQISGIVTQNVDRLHTKADSKSVIELHGTGYIVKCLSCEYRIPRHDFQMILNQLNPNLVEFSTNFMRSDDVAGTVVGVQQRPDGDVELSQDFVQQFKIPPCPDCGGDLKPEIVFFGDNVPKDRILKIVRMINESDGVLVLGSSLTVFSGYRIVLQAKEVGLPVAVVCIGKTRADDKVDLKISAKCGDIMPHLIAKR